MSYSIRITVADGKPVIGENAVSGVVPDGTIMVNGHEDDQNASIGVTRHEGANGRIVAQVSGYAARA